jgi:hypothetical protein
MTEDRFWEIIDSARRPTGLGAGHPSADPKNLRAVLAPMGSDDIVGFMVAFIHRQLALNRWNIWGAGYVITGGMSDDSFHYFASWIIGKGRACFDAALRDPESLADFAAIAEDVDNELLEYVAIEILDKRGVPDPRELVADSMDESDPAGLPFDEDTVHAIFTRLAKKFG